ncbi:ankyrin repeat domain-containing protein [Sporomusa sphaeroides]|uniref:Ankyrin repeats (3 copies) n=1 Tax=Sporomusa sphaeroides DSM 2875 TaxID=1337886 RepID=A0ABP2C334_9FIRM|nr:ankyrin repeat domain-containing protein [Sporomusa sphaeroides]OLS56310.1 ankyrin repeats (3 copies) [Sporomusa sphaeroides DSM 2875]CVK18405.1 Ankyrin repeats (3 copies) [Sporomusa sphaeroides DSM 2875]
MRKPHRQLFQMVATKDLVGVKGLLGQGLTPNIIAGQAKITPLMVAVRNNDVAMIKLPLENGAAVETANDYLGRDAYDYAEKYNSTAALMVLLSHKEDVANAIQ